MKSRKKAVKAVYTADPYPHAKKPRRNILRSLKRHSESGFPFSFSNIACLCLVLWLTSCASNSPRSASGTDIPPAAIAGAQQQVEQRQIPEPLKPEFIALYSEGRQNSVLHAMRAGLAALRLGRHDLAKETFDQAISEVEAMQEGAKQAERAKSKFVAEKEKWFKGESYERSALYFYRGLLYLEDQDYGNAAACFKRSQIEDITGDDAKDFAGDWYSDELGLALASYLNGFPDDATVALQRAEKFPSKQGNVPPPNTTTNTLIVVEVGQGPFKYRGGKYHEQLRFQEYPPVIRQIRASSPPPLISAAAENLYFQATTRGTRTIDCILGDKASFKEDTANATVGLAAGAIAASQLDNSGISAGVLGLAALGTAIFSATANAEADARSWNNLPHSIYLLNLNLPPESTSVSIEGLDAAGTVVNQLTIPLVSTRMNDKPFRIAFAQFK